MHTKSAFICIKVLFGMAWSFLAVYHLHFSKNNNTYLLCINKTKILTFIVISMFQKDEKIRILLLQKCEGLLKNEKLPWSNIELRAAINSVLTNIIESYEG